MGRAARQPGTNAQALRRVHTFDEAEVVIIPYGSSDNRRWFTVRDDRPIEIAHGDGSVNGQQGDIPGIKAQLRRNGVKTYMLLYEHVCEQKGCGHKSPTKYCPAHADPKDDVVFCMMSGAAHNTLGRVEGEAVYGETKRSG